ncbi:hypothetical protein BK816_04410 [Boudabousia tangfeifanii]|uniref:SsuA/THI5-like domain-containing protein n=1 Tax=Boudabousia tangfeifanii TaxID=1912795 RepID=A0A1D9MK20_9ACTO|nr:ABC transporter substrate-binding protein [Boudabousia tangfeifanii]AOZ72632.1 hypothetical protein BK816_04410 [Boudabousia tangfeifanii]
MLTKNNIRLGIVALTMLSLAGCGTTAPSATQNVSTASEEAKPAPTLSDPTVGTGTEIPTPTPDTEGDQTPVTIGLTYIPNIQFSPFYVAQEKNLYPNTKVTLRHHGANETLFGALAANTEQVVIAGADEALVASEHGKDFVAIGPFYVKYPVVLITDANSKITSINDLKGKKVGIPGKYGENWYALTIALQAAGLNETDVEIKEIGYTQRAALVGKQVDAVVGFSNNDFVQLQASQLAVKQVPLFNGQVPLVGASIITTRNFLKTHPKALANVISGINQGIAEVKSDPAKAIEISQKYVPTLGDEIARQNAAKTLNATLPLFANDPTKSQFDPALFEKMGAALKQVGLLQPVVNPVEHMTNEFLK